MSTDSSSAGYQHYFVYHHVYELTLAVERLIFKVQCFLDGGSLSREAKEVLLSALVSEGE